MSVMNQIRAFDLRFRENTLYVFAQIYVLAGIIATMGFYGISLVLVPELMISLGWLNLVTIAMWTINPFAHGIKFAIPILLLSTCLVYWRYKRLYRMEETDV